MGSILGHRQHDSLIQERNVHHVEEYRAYERIVLRLSGRASTRMSCLEAGIERRGKERRCLCQLFLSRFDLSWNLDGWGTWIEVRWGEKKTDGLWGKEGKMV